MRRMRLLAYCWPGLPQLSTKGSWAGLIGAVAAGSLLNVALLGTFAWCELYGSGVRIALWLAVGAVWVGAAGWTVAHRGRSRTPPTGPDRDTFEAAIDHYLKGNWYETERVLVNLLRWDESDVDARMMLATLLRHRRRCDEAAQHLESLEGNVAAWKWEWEICRERQELAARQSTERTDEQLDTAEIAAPETAAALKAA